MPPFPGIGQVRIQHDFMVRLSLVVVVRVVNIDKRCTGKTCDLLAVAYCESLREMNSKVCQTALPRVFQPKM